MVKFWRRFQVNSDIKAYFSHFKKGIITTAGLLLIAGLIVGSFIYGNQQSQEVSGPTGSEVGEVGEAPAEPDTSTREGTASNSETDNSPSGGSRRTGRIVGGSGGAAGQPTEVPNTGPEDWLPVLAATGLVLAIRKYRQSQRALNHARLG